jgi:class 3 adenylate cyclase
MFDAISGHGGVVTLMLGDGLMAVFGAPLTIPNPCESAVRAALEMIELVDLFNLERDANGQKQHHLEQFRRVGRRGSGDLWGLDADRQQRISPPGSGARQAQDHPD